MLRLLRRMGLLLAHHVISWRRSNSVAFGAKRTSAAAVCSIGFMSTRPNRTEQRVDAKAIHHQLP
jgi:hypothetical protein